jgi:hypothetical protein
MNWFFKYGWALLFLITVLIQIYMIMTIDSVVDLNKSDIILESTNWILSLAGFILFIYWAIKFNNVSVLKILTMLMPFLIMVCVTLTLIISDDKISNIPFCLIPYLIVIFIGVIISYLAKRG